MKKLLLVFALLFTSPAFAIECITVEESVAKIKQLPVYATHRVLNADETKRAFDWWNSFPPYYNEPEEVNTAIVYIGNDGSAALALGHNGICGVTPVPKQIVRDMLVAIFGQQS